MSYGLNDNVKGVVGNISKLVDKDNLVVYSLLGMVVNIRVLVEHIMHSDDDLSHLLGSYMTGRFTRDLYTYVFGFPRRKLSEVLMVLNGYLLSEALPGRIAVFIRDLVRFRNRSRPSNNQLGENSNNKRLIKVLFHSKRMDTINLPSLLHNKKVDSTILSCIDNTPPMVSYQYTNTIGNKMFNHKR